MKTEILEETIWEMMIGQYGEKNLKQLPIKALLEIAWWFYNNPVDEGRIKMILQSYNLPFKPI